MSDKTPKQESTPIEKPEELSKALSNNTPGVGKPAEVSELATGKVKKNFFKSKKFLYSLITISLVIIVALILGVAYLLTRSEEEAEDTSVEEEKVIEEEEAEEEAEAEEEEEVSPGLVSAQRIAYKTENNLWVVNPDGTGKKQITTDGNDDTIWYTAFDWKSAGILSYAKCAADCRVYNKNISTMVETEVFTAAPFTQRISDMEWSHNGNTLGYIFTKADFSYEAVLRTGGSAITLKSWGIPPARGGGYFDGIEIGFSPDDSKVLVLNTIVGGGENTVTAFSSAGAVIVGLADVSFPTFDGNSGFYYSDGDKIKKYDFSTSSSSNVYTFPSGNMGLNLRTSLDRNFIAFWTEAAGVYTLGYYDTGGSPSPIATGYSNPGWLDAQYLVALKSVESMSGMGAESQGLYKIKRTDGTTTTLETKPVYNFEIE